MPRQLASEVGTDGFDSRPTRSLMQPVDVLVDRFVLVTGVGEYSSKLYPTQSPVGSKP